MKLEQLAASIEDARKEVARVNLLSKKASTLNKEDLPEGFNDELEKSINGLSKMLISLYKEIEYKAQYVKYNEKDGNTFYRGDLSIKENENYDTSISRMVGSLNSVYALLSKFNNEENKSEYQRIVTKSLSFIELKKSYFTAHTVAIESLNKAISMLTETTTKVETKAEAEVEEAAKVEAEVEAKVEATKEEEK